MPLFAIYGLVGLGLLVAGFVTGWETRGWRDDSSQLAIQKAQTAAVAAAAAEARQQQIAADKIGFTIGLSFAQEQMKIIGLTVTQIRKVPVYVDRSADDACQLRNGFVQLHDAAARGDDPASSMAQSPGGAVDSPAGVRLSDVAATVTVNYGKYHQVANELRKLQGWVTEQEALHNVMRGSK
jgi:hypothetical protein